MPLSRSPSDRNQPQPPGQRQPPRSDAPADPEPSAGSAGHRYAATAANSHEPCREAGAPVQGVSADSYNLSFTAASLRPELARILAECFLAVGDWDRVKAQVLATNALQCRSASSTVRLERELQQRLQTLTPEQLSLLAKATAEDCAAMAWLAVCKRSPFVREFAAEVLRDKLAAHDAVLRPSDYESYVEHKSLPHPELARLTPSSKRKIRQVLLKMLAEAGLLVSTRHGAIQRPVLSPAVLRALTADNPRWLAGFLVPDAEIASLSPP